MLKTSQDLIVDFSAEEGTYSKLPDDSRGF
jgi:hypothetical protein